MKVYIDYQFRNGPYGGANQFLKTLRDYLIQNDLYTEQVEQADCVLLNHTSLSKEVLTAKCQNPKLVFVHRMDGPVSKHRPRAKIHDWQSFLLDKLFCEGTVFQSTWTKDNCFAIGYRQTGVYAIIHNAPAPDVFYKEDKKEERHEKIRLVSTSWSANWNKGFDVLQYLDAELDFNKYEVTFIGRSPVEFKNIQILEPMASKELAEELRKHDIFIAVSRNESCSNSLIEAINCGLAVVARDSGCYREIIKDGGLIFQNLEDGLVAIDKVASELEEYQNRLPYYSIEGIGKEYYQFMENTVKGVQQGNIPYKKVGFYKKTVWKMSILIMKIYNRIIRIIEGNK